MTAATTPINIHYDLELSPNSVSEQKKIRERYLAIMSEELNGNPNLWHQNGLSFEPLMSISDGNIHGAFVADYIALYRDPISIHCNDCQGNHH